MKIERLVGSQVVGLQPAGYGWATFWLFNFLMHQFAVRLCSCPNPRCGVK